MSTYTLKYNRNTVHIAGIAEKTQVSADGMNYAQSACPTLTRSTNLATGAGFDTAADAMTGARTNAAANGRKVCKHCEKAAESETTTTTTDTPEETPVTTDPTVHTADTVTLPDGITETPALRPVYAAILNAGFGTAKDIVDATGIILPKVRVALNTLKAAGLITGTDQTKPGQSVVWSAFGNPITVTADDATALFANTLSLDAPADDTDHDAGWNTMNDDNEDPKPNTDTDADDDDDTDADNAPAQTVDAPPATRRAPKRVRLLAIYPGETARAERTGPFKTVRPNENPLTRGGLIAEVTEWFATHAGEDVTVSRIGKELNRYPTAVARSIDRMAAKDARYAKVEGATTRTYRFDA